MTRTTLLAVAATLFMAALASADALNTNRPIVPSNGFGGEDSLQEVFDDITTSGPGIDAVNDQSQVALWTNEASGNSIATFVIELASGAEGSQNFGLYDANDSSNRIEIFGGADSSGDAKVISFLANGGILINFAPAGSIGAGGFGFYYEFTGAGSTRYFTEDSLNGGNPQALVYQGDGVTTLQIPPFAGGTFSTSHWIIAFEGSPFSGNGNDDFQDLVVLVESITPIPEPGTFALLAAGVVAFGLVRRRRKNASA